MNEEKKNTDNKATNPKVKWDDSDMKTTYANVVNAASTHEEITMFFGTNQTWNLADTKELVVKLSDRIVCSPFAAKRLHVLLGAVLKEYESRYGVLDLENRIRQPPVGKA